MKFLYDAARIKNLFVCSCLGMKEEEGEKEVETRLKTIQQVIPLSVESFVFCLLSSVQHRGKVKDGCFWSIYQTLKTQTNGSGEPCRDTCRLLMALKTRHSECLPASLTWPC